MVVGTLLAIVALLNQVPSLSELWDTVRTANWWWVLLAVVFAFGNKVGYALALMGSVSKRLPLLRSIEALLAAAFANLAVPGIGSTAVQVRYLQCQGIELAAAVAAGAVLANVANVVVQGALFLVALVPLLTTQSVDTSKLDLNDAAHVGARCHLPRRSLHRDRLRRAAVRRRTVPPTKRGIETIRTALRSPRQIVLLVVGNLMAILMSTLCLFASVEAYGGSVSYWRAPRGQHRRWDGRVADPHSGRKHARRRSRPLRGAGHFRRARDRRGSRP